jgi:aminoglycoside phosphotransferase (APT) family kinase protein
MPIFAPHTTSSPSPLPYRPRTPDDKVAYASISFYEKISHKLSPILRRKVRHEAYITSNLSAASHVLTSTNRTELSLPLLEYSPTFETLGPSLVVDTHSRDHKPEVAKTAVETTIETNPTTRSASQDDFVLESCADTGAHSTDHEQNAIVAEQSKLRQWSRRIKAKVIKLSKKLTGNLHGHDADGCHDDNDDGAEFASHHDDNELDAVDDEAEDYEDDDDDEYPRCDFKTIAAISDFKLQNLVRSCCSSVQDMDAFHVVHRTRGSWNFAAMVNLIQDGHIVQEYVVRVPGHGTPEHWTSQDGYMLEREVQLINYIRMNTTVPVSEILDFDTSHDNILGYPYILMVKLPGENAGSIWFDQSYDPEDVTYAYRMADAPTIATEKKRLNFLRSLARHMTSLQTLSFDRIGMPIVSDPSSVPTIGPHYHWKNDGSDEAVERQEVPNTQSYALFAILKKLKFDLNTSYDEDDYRKFHGNRLILHMIFRQSVFDHPAPETFTIHHNDLDLQNILVDNDGNVTGIIDWDSSFAAPRCIGAAAVPLFLRHDWYPRYAHSILNTPHMAWNFQHYREIYAAAMVEAGNPDAKYTLNSALYQSAFAAITEGGDRYDLVKKLLQEIPNCRVDSNDFQIAMGCSWPAAEEMLEAQLPKIFKPQLPHPDLLVNLDKEIALKEWWFSFEGCFEDLYDEECTE